MALPGTLDLEEVLLVARKAEVWLFACSWPAASARREKASTLSARLLTSALAPLPDSVASGILARRQGFGLGGGSGEEKTFEGFVKLQSDFGQASHA